MHRLVAVVVSFTCSLALSLAPSLGERNRGPAREASDPLPVDSYWTGAGEQEDRDGRRIPWSMALHIDSRDGDRVTASAWYPRLARGVSRFEGSVGRDGRITLHEVEVVYGHYKQTSGGIGAGARFEAEVKSGVLKAMGTLVDEQTGAEHSITFSVRQAGAAPTNASSTATSRASAKPAANSRYAKELRVGSVFARRWDNERGGSGESALVITGRNGAKFEGLEFMPAGRNPYIIFRFEGEIGRDGVVTRTRGRMLHGQPLRQSELDEGDIEGNVWRSKYVWTNEEDNTRTRGSDIATLIE